MEGQEAGNEQIARSNFWLIDGDFRLVWKLVSYIAIFILSLLVYSLALFLLPVGDYVSYAYVFAFLGAGFTATAFSLKGIEQKPILNIGLHRPAMFAGTFAGNIYGGLLVVLTVAILLLTQAVYIEPSKFTSGAIVGVIVNGLVFFFFVGFSEELLMRGYPFQLLYQKYGAAMALVLTSAFFSLLHIANPNVTFLSFVNIFLAGMLLGTSYLATGSLWMPIGLHMGWNFVQGTVFGFPVSGIIKDSAFVAIPVGSDLMSGGLFGIEGSIIASVVLAGGTVLLWLPPVVKMLPGNPVAGFGVSKVEKITKE